MTDTPMPFVYMGDGEFHAASPHWAKRAGEVYREGQKYTLTELFERSPNSHAHFFAAVNEAWKNLPDEYAVDFPTSEMLRKHALIMTGHYNESRMIFESPVVARKVAAELSRHARRHEYCIISVNGCAVVQRWAKSQDYKSMDRKEFQQSKTDVLEWLAVLIGIDVDDLSANAGKAA